MDVPKLKTRRDGSRGGGAARSAAMDDLIRAAVGRALAEGLTPAAVHHLCVCVLTCVGAHTATARQVLADIEDGVVAALWDHAMSEADDRAGWDGEEDGGRDGPEGGG